MRPEPAAALSLLNAEAVRGRAHRLLALAFDGKLGHFRVDLGKLDDAAELVIEVTRAAYPSLDVPFHSRWRHFVVNGTARTAGPQSSARRPTRRNGAMRQSGRERRSI
jgi:hypothetical protein